MVQQVETIANIARRQGQLGLARDLMKVVEVNRGRAPDVLDGVVLYDKESEENLYRHTMFEHYRSERRLILPKGSIALTPREDQLLTVFEETPNKTRSSEELLETVFGKGRDIGILTKYVELLRKKIESDPKKPEIFLTKRGLGYLFRDSIKKNLLEDKDPERVHFHSGFRYYPERSVVVVNGAEASLTMKECKYLDKLFLYKIATYEMLEGKHVQIIKSRVKSAIMGIRRKIEPDKRGTDYQYLISVPEIGYRLRGLRREPEKIDV